MRLVKVALFAWLWLVACETPAAKTYPMTIQVRDEDLSPLSEVRISVNGGMIGVTDERGLLQARLTGQEGDLLSISARCPAGYRNSSETRNVILRSFDHLNAGPAARGPELDWRCLPAERLAALVVRAPGQSGLPVVIHGKEVTRTRPDGVAHALLKMAPGSSLRVALDTSNRPQLRPRSPVRAFQVEDQDAIFIFDQEFTAQRRPARRKPLEPKRNVPYKLE
jgi:hypothetical protein